MRNGFLFLSLFLAGICSGCGRSPAPSLVPASSYLHGGILVPLPDSLGYVELLNDGGVRKGRTFLTKIVAYLLQPDQKTPVSQQAKSVTIKLGAPPEEITVPLRQEPDKSDPSGASRYVSELGPFSLNQAGGEILVVLDGKTLTSPFRGPR